MFFLVLFHVILHLRNTQCSTSEGAGGQENVGQGRDSSGKKIEKTKMGDEDRKLGSEGVKTVIGKEPPLSYFRKG